MKAITLKWQSSAGNEGLILPETKVLAAKVILPKSNQPYQPNVATNDSGQYFMPTGYRSVGFTVTGGAGISTDVIVTITGKGLVLNANTFTPTEEITDTVTLTTGTTYIETNKYFSQVTSFSFNGALPNTVTVQAGLGRKGLIKHYLDTNVTPPMDYAVQVYPVTGATGFQYQLFVTLLNPYDITSQYYATYQPFPSPVIGFPVMPIVNNTSFLTTSKNMVGVNNTTTYGAISPATLLWLTILDAAGSPNEGTGSLYFTVLQQGTRS